MVVYCDLLSDDVLIKFYYLKNAGFVIYFEQKYFVEGIFRKRPTKECVSTLSALVDRGFYPTFWSFTVFCKLSELMWTGPLLACLAERFVSLHFTDWETYWVSLQKRLAKELARAANEHKNETINDSPWLWKKGLCHYSCECKFKIFWQDSLAFATLFIR